jgi:hypothetical protein
MLKYLKSGSRDFTIAYYIDNKNPLLVAYFQKKDDN